MKLSDIFGKNGVGTLVYDLSAASNGLTQQIMAGYNKRRPAGPQPLICYSPSKNMYFGHKGKVVTCCYNREYMLGSYPYQTIKDIWFGDTRKQLMNHIAKNDLSHGCFGCLTQMVAENFEATKAKQYDTQALNENGFPSMMEFELDNICNLECVMCNGNFSSLIRKNRENLEALNNPYDKDFVKQLEEFIPFLDEVKFFGGEPFLVEIYYDIIELIIKIKPTVRISIQTNGTVLNNRVRSILSLANVNLSLSIDSLNKANYESIRVNANFDRVMENLEYFNRYAKEKGAFFGISVCAMKNNWHELPDFVRFCNARNLRLNVHTVFSPLLLSLHSLDSKALEMIAKATETELSHLPQVTDIEKDNKQHVADFVKQVWYWHQKNVSTDKYLHELNERFVRIDTFDDFVNMIEGQVQLLEVNTRDVYRWQKDKALNILRELRPVLPVDFDYRTFFKAPVNTNGSFITDNKVLPVQELVEAISKSSTEDIARFMGLTHRINAYQDL